MAGVGFINAIVFGVQHNVQRTLEPGLSSECIAGGIAGAVQSIVNCPVELAKTRLQVQQSKLKAHEMYHGSLDCLQKIFQRSGLKGCYKGMTITLIRETPSFVIYFGTFDIMCTALTPKGSSVDSVGPLGLLLAGGLSGTASWVFTYPIDVMKSRIQADGDGKDRKYKDLVDCIKKTYRTGGLRAFSQGLTPTIIRSFPTNAATFPTVKLILRFAGNQEKALELP